MLMRIYRVWSLSLLILVHCVLELSAGGVQAQAECADQILWFSVWRVCRLLTFVLMGRFIMDIIPGVHLGDEVYYGLWWSLRCFLIAFLSFFYSRQQGKCEIGGWLKLVDLRVKCIILSSLGRTLLLNNLKNIHFKIQFFNLPILLEILYSMHSRAVN